MIDFLLILAGWAFLFYLSNRNFKLAEIAKAKEKLIDELRGLYSWLENKSDTKTSKNLSDTLLEELFVSLVTRLEYKTKQINLYTGGKIIKEDDFFFKLRNLEISQEQLKNEELLHIANMVVSDFIESIETSYDEYIKHNNNIFRHIYIYKRPELLGAVFSAVILYLFFSIASLVLS